MKRQFHRAVFVCVSASAADEFVPVDLQPFGNHKLAEGFGNGLETNNLASLPSGDQKLDGCKFGSAKS